LAIFLFSRFSIFLSYFLFKKQVELPRPPACLYAQAGSQKEQKECHCYEQSGTAILSIFYSHSSSLSNLSRFHL